MATDARSAITRPLQSMFMAVPRRYDLINRVITWGLDERWRRRAAQQCLIGRPERVLDLCCGTGDLVVRLARMANGRAETWGVDYSAPMLELALKKAASLSNQERPRFVHADAAALPFPDASFDCIGISFAFRNLTYRNPKALRYLAEAVRVLRPGGRFVIVESSQPGSRMVRRLFHAYLRTFVFRVGYLLSGNRGAYAYLAESAARFYAPGELEELLLDAGFRQVSSRPMLLGAVAIHVAVR